MSLDPSGEISCAEYDRGGVVTFFGSIHSCMAKENIMTFQANYASEFFNITGLTPTLTILVRAAPVFMT